MTKDELYKKAEELITKNKDKGMGYIRGCLNVKEDGPLSEKLRQLREKYTTVFKPPKVEQALEPTNDDNSMGLEAFT